MRRVVECVLAALVAAGMSFACRQQGPGDTSATTPRPSWERLARAERGGLTLAARRSASPGASGERRLESLLPVHLGEPWAQARLTLLQVGAECRDWATPDESFVECKIKPDKDQVLDGFYWCRAGSIDGRTVNRINLSAAR